MLRAKIAVLDAKDIRQKNAVKFATCSCMNAIAQNATMTSAGTEFPAIPSTVVRFADQCVRVVLEIHILVGLEIHTARFVVMEWKTVETTIHPMNGDWLEVNFHSNVAM